MNEDIVVPIAGMLMIIIISIGVPLVVALGKKWQRDADAPRAPSMLPELAERLQHMEQAIDAMSIEVERISEGQRFVTKILADRPREPIALPRSSSSEGD